MFDIKCDPQHKSRAQLPIPTLPKSIHVGSRCVFAVKSRKECEISTKVVRTRPSKLASAVLSPETGPSGSNYPWIPSLGSPCAHALDFIEFPRWADM